MTKSKTLAVTCNYINHVTCLTMKNLVQGIQYPSWQDSQHVGGNEGGQ